ncbi:hypothetical protein FHK87_04410 [Aquimarina algicola]|uniref:Lipocalin-like domain-containing protein n=1 Tax=Aquimarina algicola TaxID=2589995 RepID=A0A504JK24_9FLAO|nr:hypothetical protein FHK87_04410 [Aquimarina algicola]
MLLTLVFGFNSCLAQSDVKDKLIGKWTLIAESDSFPDDIDKLSIGGTDSDVETVPEITLIFKPDNSLLVIQMGDESNSTFKISDSILTMGNRKYIIVRVDNKELLLKNKNDLFNTQYKYQKNDE